MIIINNGIRKFFMYKKIMIDNNLLKGIVFFYVLIFKYFSMIVYYNILSNL